MLDAIAATAKPMREAQAGSACEEHAACRGYLIAQPAIRRWSIDPTAGIAVRKMLIAVNIAFDAPGCGWRFRCVRCQGDAASDGGADTPGG